MAYADTDEARERKARGEKTWLDVCKHCGFQRMEHTVWGRGCRTFEREL